MLKNATLRQGFNCVVFLLCIVFAISSWHGNYPGSQLANKLHSSIFCSLQIENSKKLLDVVLNLEKVKFAFIALPWEILVQMLLNFVYMAHPLFILDKFLVYITLCL